MLCSILTSSILRYFDMITTFIGMCVKLQIPIKIMFLFAIIFVEGCVLGVLFYVQRTRSQRRGDVD